MSPALQIVREALDDLDEMHSALEGMRDLLEPSRLNDDLNCVNRGHLATLVTVLLRQQAAIHARAHDGFANLREAPEQEQSELQKLAAALVAHTRERNAKGANLDTEKPE